MKALSSTKSKKPFTRQVVLVNFFLVLFSLMSLNCSSQDDYRKLHGSLIIENKVYNYEFIRNAKVGFALSLEKILVKQDLMETFDKKLYSLQAKRYPDFINEELRMRLDSSNYYNLGLNTWLDSLSSKADSIYQLSALSKLDVFEKEIKKLHKNLDSLTGDSNSNNLTEKIKTSVEQFKQSDKTSIFFVFGVPEEVLDFADTLIYRTSLIDDTFKMLQELKKNLEDMKLLNQLKKNELKSNQIIFNENDLETFKGAFSKLLETVDPEVHKEINKKKGEELSVLKETGTALFYEIKNRLSFEEDQMEIALIKLKSGVANVYIDKTEKGSKKEDQESRKNKLNRKLVYTYNIENVDIEFEDGTIKNVEVILIKEDGSLLRFRNSKPIATIGKLHSERFGKHRIYLADKSTKDYLFLNFGELFYYLPQLKNHTENYAPENQVIRLEPKSGMTFNYLKKEVTSEILEVRVYSDLKGLKTGEPNGLIQTEFARRFDINSYHWRLASERINHAILRYVKPYFIMSNINQKEIVPFLRADTVNNLSMVRNQFVRFGADFSIWKVNFPNLQLNAQVIGSTNWFGSNTEKDNEEKKQEYSTLHKLGAQFELKPETRWGANIRWDFWAWQNLLNTEYKQESGKSYGTKSVSFEAFFKTSKTNKFFFRWRLNYIKNESSFNELQIGFKSSLQKYIDGK